MVTDPKANWGTKNQPPGATGRRELRAKEVLIKSLGSSVHPRVPCGLCFLPTLNRSFPKGIVLPFREICIQERRAKTLSSAPMFRNTFAVEMLRAGWLLEPISILLGHKYVKVIAKHYAPWGYDAPGTARGNVRVL